MTTGFPGGFDPGAIGSRMADEGPGALLDEIENLIPEEWREHISAFPLTAVAIGLGVGIWLGLKKSEDVLSAGSTILSTAAAANLTQVMEKMKG